MRYFQYIRIASLCLLAASAINTSFAEGSHAIRLLPEFRPIGGAGNNLNNRSFDPVPGNPELHLAPLNFAPGTTNDLKPAPNPRTISNVIAGGTGSKGEDAQVTDPTASAWLYVFGQFVDHDIDLENSPTTNAAINITVPPNDPVFTPGTEISLTRDSRSPTTNTVINTVAGFLDLSQLYGSTGEVANSLRNADGTLKTSNNGKSLSIVDGRYVAGDPRVMENPELTAVTTLFMREHNYWVDQAKNQNPGWTGDQLYNMAKAITTAEYQNIVYSEYLPVLIGRVIGQYAGYDPQVNAQVTQEFSTAAFRVGHTQVSETQTGIDNRGMETFSETLAQSFFNTPAIDEANGFDPLMRSLGAEFSQATDVYTVPTLRNLLFAPLVGGNVDQIDLIAIDIQRELDVGIGTLNQTRKAINLPAYKSFAELTADPVLQQNFKTVYGDINNVDLFMGGLAESHASGAAVGPTFQSIIRKQFEAMRNGDRFFWKNQNFDPQTSATIASTTLAVILKRNTDTIALQENVFLVSPPVTPHRRHPADRNIDNHGRRGTPFIVR